MNRRKIKRLFDEIKNEHLILVFFIVSNLINSTILRIITVKNILNISPLLIDLGFLLMVSLISLLFKKEKRIRFYVIVSILFTLICIIDSVYYHYYNSFASISLLAIASFAGKVSDAILENVLKPIDFIYLWGPIALYLFYRCLKKRKYFKKEFVYTKKSIVKSFSITSIILFAISSFLMPLSSWSRLLKLWNRESVVMNYGIYIYQIDDFIQSLTPEINNLFGHDNALKEVNDYYSENEYKEIKNKYTNIFKGKNVIVIHAESMQTFAMNLKFSGEEVTPNLNKLKSEGIFFDNFYSQVGVGTSSDAEFTFNTSLMPSTNGTVFVNYFNNEYIAIPKLLKEKGYYTYSMHGNVGSFWNRFAMHKNLGYDNFYSKDSYLIDETIGLGLSDKSFFNQSVTMMKEIANEKSPYYALLIMLSNHTPFSDLELMDEYPTTIDVEINNQTITREYLNGTIMGNYLRSAHYADEAIGEFIDSLENNKLLDNTVLVIYGDHDARIDYDEFNLLYNYDPVTDTILTKDDEEYKNYNDYTYELDKKVPFIIWTKDQQFNLNIDTPTGMIDVLPTLGNMLGIHSEYQLGTDILGLKEGEDNTVVLVDGSFITSKVYYNGPKEEFYSIGDAPITEDYIKDRVNYSSKLIEISNNIITYNLIKELKKTL